MSEMDTMIIFTLSMFIIGMVTAYFYSKYG